jgi:CheY-like chemotaxis protein
MEEDPGRGDGSGVRVLVVEDNADSAEALVLLLRMLGNEVEVALDGASGLQAAEAHRPEVVLLDIGLPEMNGYDVARKIREQPWGGQMALVALTGWGQDEDRRLAKEAGFDHHLVKPVDPQKLMPLFQTLRAKKNG